MVKLGDVARVVSGGTPKTSVPEYWDGDVPWLTPKDLSVNADLWIRGGTRFITDLGLTKSGAVLLPKGTVLWSSRAPIGLVAIADIPVSTNQGFKSFIPSNTLDSGYLAYWLIANRTALQALGVGATFKEVSGKRAAEIQIPLPPLNEQKRIAEILGGVADSIARLEKQRELVNQLEQLWFNELNKLSDQSRTYLKDVCSVQTGSTPSRKIAAYYNGDIPWVKTGEVTGQKIESTEEHVTELAIQETNCRIFPVGTTLVAMYGQGATRGRAGILGCKAATNQACAAVITNNPENQDFVFAVLRNSYNELRNLGRGGTQPNLNLTLVKNFEIPWPEKKVREEFVQNWKMINHLRQLLHQKLTLLQELQRSLSARAFAGQL